MTDMTATHIWRDYVYRFQCACEDSNCDEQEDRLREAIGFLPYSATEPLAVDRVHVDTAFVETLILKSAFESAALAIIGQNTPFILSRSREGDYLATIADHGLEVSAHGASFALAVLAAWAGMMLAHNAETHHHRGNREKTLPVRVH